MKIDTTFATAMTHLDKGIAEARQVAGTLIKSVDADKTGEAATADKTRRPTGARPRSVSVRV